MNAKKWMMELVGRNAEAILGYTAEQLDAHLASPWKTYKQDWHIDYHVPPERLKLHPCIVHSLGNIYVGKPKEGIHFPITIFTDIDGCIVEQMKHVDPNAPVINRTVEQLRKWRKEGHIIVLTTGRAVKYTKTTEEYLKKNDIPYDRLVMDIGSGPRVLINDLKPYSSLATAMSVNLKRNAGYEIDLQKLSDEQTAMYLYYSV